MPVYVQHEILNRVSDVFNAEALWQAPGLALFNRRPLLRDLWDWSVWLDVPYEVAYARMALRDGCDPDPEAPSNARYRLGQQLYLDEADPAAAASAIIDNADLAHPRRVFESAR